MPDTPVRNANLSCGTHYPHCGFAALVRSSKQLTAIYRELRFECINEACNHIWVAGMVVLRTIVPSEALNPDISIPLAKHLLPAANDETLYPPP